MKPIKPIPNKTLYWSLLAGAAIWVVIIAMITHWVAIIAASAICNVIISQRMNKQEV